MAEDGREGEASYLQALLIHGLDHHVTKAALN
jgi:hypothetical protein